MRSVYIGAPAEVLAARLRRRGREGDAAGRLSRAHAFTAAHADIVIDNGGRLDTAVAAFLAAG